MATRGAVRNRVRAHARHAAAAATAAASAARAAAAAAGGRCGRVARRRRLWARRRGRRSIWSAARGELWPRGSPGRRRRQCRRP
eukprot:388037-Prymnesium_polylepis.1